MKQLSSIFKAMFSRRWIVATVIVIIGMGVMIRLGIWQLDRLDERRAQNAALLAVLESDALSLNEPLSEAVDALKDRIVVADGAFDFDEQVILLVQNWSGAPGVHLLTPFVLEGTDTAVIVDRGWVPQRDVDAENLTIYDDKRHQLDGFVALSQPPPRYGDAEAAPAGPQSELYRVDVERLQAQSAYDLLPFYVLQAPEGNEAPPFRLEPEVDLSEGPHLSYAIQWFFFTTILGVGYVVLVYRRMKEDESEAVSTETPALESSE